VNLDVANLIAPIFGAVNCIETYNQPDKSSFVTKAHISLQKGNSASGSGCLSFLVESVVI
jgi:hypothetical protein